MNTIAKYVLTALGISGLLYCLNFVAGTSNDIDVIVGHPIRQMLFNSNDRQLQTVIDAAYYYTITDKAILGSTNPEVAIGNPLKGLLTSPDWSGETTPAKLPTSLEFYYIGLDQIMIGNNKFDWSFLDNTLAEAARRYKHVIWRVYCHYPGREIGIPQYLIDLGIDFDDGTPDYDDVNLQNALEKFIKAFGARYDGHKSIAFIQMGLLGYWGEWHTYPDDNLLSDETKKKVYSWYKSSFKVTKLQARDPDDAPGGDIGFHDDSFAYTTLGPHDWYFGPKLVNSRNAGAWTKHVIGGETSPNLQSIIFESWYRPGSDNNRQDFMECVRATHASYMIHGNAFKDGGYSGTELSNARFAHARMGYNYVITKIGAISSSANMVAVDVTIMQIGVAPFYYPLSLVLSCAGTKRAVGGLESVLDDTNEVKTYRFEGFPTDASCLKSMTVQLVSSVTYDEQPIKFAQGNGLVSFSLPLPTVPTAPTGTTLALVDAVTSTKIRNITDGMTINLADHQAINILAEPLQALVIGSVEFSDNGKFLRLENEAPFISGNAVNSWKPTLGEHIIKATPFTEPYRGGTTGLPVIVKVLVVDQKLVPTKAPIATSPVFVSKLSLMLIDADKNIDVTRMTAGMKIDLNKYPMINIRVDIDPSLSSINRVEFRSDGDLIRVEHNAPFTFYGNDGTDFHGWKSTVGDHSVEVRAFRDNSLVASVSLSFSTVR